MEYQLAGYAKNSDRLVRGGMAEDVEVEMGGFMKNRL